MSIGVEILHQLKEHPLTHPLTYPLICKHPLSLYLSRIRKNPRTRERKQ